MFTFLSCTGPLRGRNLQKCAPQTLQRIAPTERKEMQHDQTQTCALDIMRHIANALFWLFLLSLPFPCLQDLQKMSLRTLANTSLWRSKERKSSVLCQGQSSPVTTRLESTELLEAESELVKLPNSWFTDSR